ncbi:MAG: 50S ribosomal protein L19 [Leptospirillum sp.]|jgi:large subunit ribosomal protein L19|nr:50S ribosomal protein L19 [Nitrospiraceae bacterium]
MNVIDQVEQLYMKENPPEARIGETVRVHLKIVEGEKERIQVFEGVVIALRGGGTRSMMTVRKISFGVGVERIFPLHSPQIIKIERVRVGKVRRAKLYFLRTKKGKAARLKEVETRREPKA